MIGSNEVAVTGVAADGTEFPLLRGRGLADLRPDGEHRAPTDGREPAVRRFRPTTAGAVADEPHASPRPHATLTPTPTGEVPERLNGRDWKSRNGG